MLYMRSCSRWSSDCMYVHLYS